MAQTRNPDIAETLPVAAIKLRVRLQRQMGDEFLNLRKLNHAKRIREVLIFSLIWAAGVWIGLLGLEAPGSVGWSLRIFGIVIVALALNAYLLLSHEAHHMLLSRRQSLNRWFALFFAAPLLHSPSAYRVLHTKHHRHLGEENDPDDYTGSGRRARAVWALHWVRLLIGMVPYLLYGPILAYKAATHIGRKRIVLEYIGLITLWTLLIASVPIQILLQVWLIPAVLVFYFTSVRGLAQHGFADMKDPHLMARTMKINPVAEFLLLNENYHLEHHLFPEVPSYNLKRLHVLLWPQIPRATVESAYTRFLWKFIKKWWRNDATPMGAIELKQGIKQ